MIKRIYNKINSTIRKLQWADLQKKLNFTPEKVMIIAGDPRGGSTWITEVIQQIPKAELLWEPLWIDREPTFSRLGFAHRQYLPENSEENAIRNAFEMLFSGQILNNHLGQMTTPKAIKDAEHLIVKFCRANQLLPWLIKNFDFRYAPIYIIRHPCAVVASQLNQGSWDHTDDTFHVPECKYQSFYKDHSAFLDKIKTKTKKLAAIWALCNAIPLNHPQNNKKWITITYESLVMNGEQELKRIEERWGLKFPIGAYDMLNKASATTIAGSPVLLGKGSQLEYWSKQLSRDQIDEIMDVLDYFNINLYDRDFLPNKEFLN